VLVVFSNKSMFLIKRRHFDIQVALTLTVFANQVSTL
jgi:hypothetical protein